jgi:DNA-binding GntR family transcriptional regulator
VQVREIYFVRQHLLALVGQLVAEKATDEDLVGLRKRLTQMEVDAASGDIDSYFWGQVALQERMTEIAGNGTLKGILDSLALRTLILRHASLAQPGRLADSVTDQLRIFEAIRNRDGELAAMLLSRATVAALRAIEESEWPQRQPAS